MDVSVYDYDKKTNAYKNKQGRVYRFKQFMRKINADTKLSKNDLFHVK